MNTDTPRTRTQAAAARGFTRLAQISQEIENELGFVIRKLDTAERELAAAKAEVSNVTEELARRDALALDEPQLRAQLALAEKCVEELRSNQREIGYKPECLAAYDKFKDGIK